MAGAHPPIQTFDSLTTQVLNAMGTGDRVETWLSGSTLRGDVRRYAQSNPDQYRERHSNRLPTPREEESFRFHQDYH